MTDPYLTNSERLLACLPLIYPVCVLMQLPAMIARFFVFGTIASLAAWILGKPHYIAYIAAWAGALWPVAWSLLTLVIDDPGYSMLRRLGARPPSERENVPLQAAFETLRQRNPDIPRPRRVWVEDSQSDNAYAAGRCVVFTRGCVYGRYLEATVAHELGHLARYDGRKTTMLYRLRFPLIPGDGPFARLLSGELSLSLAMQLWAPHVHIREYAADHYAASLGCGHDLADFFETAVDHDQPQPYRWLRNTNHPPSEYRIQRLRWAAELYDALQEDFADQPYPQLQGELS